MSHKQRVLQVEVVLGDCLSVYANAGSSRVRFKRMWSQSNIVVVRKLLEDSQRSCIKSTLSSTIDECASEAVGKFSKSPLARSVHVAQETICNLQVFRINAIG